MMDCGDVPRDSWEENFCPSCVCELPPEEPSACEDVSLEFNGALTAKYGGSEGCSTLVPNWAAKTAITAQQMCQVPLSQFVELLNGTWAMPAGTAADAKLHDFCKATCGFENVGDCAATLQPQCETVRDSGCSHIPHLTSCVDGHSLYSVLTCDGTAPDAPADFTSLDDALVVRTTDHVRSLLGGLTGGSRCKEIESGSGGMGGDWTLYGFDCPNINVIELEEGTTFKLGGNELVIPSFLGVKIVGRGAGATIDGEGLSRIIDASAGSVLLMENVHLVNGATTGDGGGIRAGAKTDEVAQDGSVKLWLKDVSISDTTADGNGGCVWTSESFIWAEGFVFQNVNMERCARARAHSLCRRPRRRRRCRVRLPRHTSPVAPSSSPSAPPPIALGAQLAGAAASSLSCRSRGSTG